MTEHSCPTVSLKSSWCAFHFVQRHTHLLCFAHLRLACRHRSLVGRVIRCSTLLVNKLPLTLNIKIDLRMCFTQTSVINLALTLLLLWFLLSTSGYESRSRFHRDLRESFLADTTNLKTVLPTGRFPCLRAEACWGERGRGEEGK